MESHQTKVEEIFDNQKEIFNRVIQQIIAKTRLETRSKTIEECACLVDHILAEGGRTQGDLIRQKLLSII